MVLLAVGALCILSFALIRLPRAMRAEHSLISGDGPGYYSYLRSFVFDRDLDFRNEYRHFDFDVERTTATGLAPNPWSVGPALLWAPFYLMAHVLSLITRMFGVRASADGYGYIYESAIYISTIAYVTAGSFLIYRVCRRYFSPWSSLVAVLGVCLASSLLHYAVASAAMSHGVSFFAVSLFLFLWHPPRSRTKREWVLLGVSAGLMILVRWQNALYVTILAVEGIQAFRVASAGNRAAVLRKYLTGGLIAAPVGVAVFLPQMLAWNALYGSPIAIPQGAGFFDWLHPQLLAYLFSTTPGLYARHPVMLVATLGLALLWRRDGRVAVALLVPLFLQWYLNSAIAEGLAHHEYAFGARRFISATALLALGMAALLESVTQRFRRGHLVVLSAVAVLIGWNFLFELQYSWGFTSYSEPLTWDELTIGKFRMLAELIRQVIDLPSEHLQRKPTLQPVGTYWCLWCQEGTKRRFSTSALH
jgi:hypothetical protein